MRNLILVSGPPGIGKSTLANELSKNISLCILDKDCIDEPFSPNDRGEVYTKEIEPKTLQSLLNLAEKNIRNINVLLDAPWTHIIIDNPKWEQKIIQLCEQTNSSLKIIEMFLDENSLKVRISTRGLSRDQNKLSGYGWLDFVKRDKVQCRIPMDHLAVDASVPIEKYINNVISYINS